MNIELLIATVRGRWPELMQKAESRTGLNVVISNQYELDSEKLVPEGDVRSENVRVLNFSESGVSKSRNRSLEVARGDICVLCDDDTELVPGFARRLEAVFLENPGADLLTFRIRTRDGRPYKRYLPFGYRHNVASVLTVSEVEIAFRLESVRRALLRFDERFGLGARFPSGEGNVFLSDALRAGLNVKYVPEELVIHDWESSGKDFGVKEMIYSKGALFRRMYGAWGGWVVSWVFLMLKLPLYSRHISPMTALRLIRSGSRDFVG